MPRPRVWVVTPEVHRHGGSERAIAEQILRWSTRFDIRVYTMSGDGDILPGIDVRIVRGPSGPHLIRFAWWFVANRVRRMRDGRRSGEPDATVSPGVNSFDADAIGVQMVFANYGADHRIRATRRVRLGLLSARRWHRVVYASFLRALERMAYTGGGLLWSLSERDRRQLEARFARPPSTIAVIPHGVDADAFQPDRRLSDRSRARRTLDIDTKRVVLLIGNDVWAKGVDLAIRSVALLDDHVVLALAGHLRAEEIAKVMPVGNRSDRIRVWPHVPDPLAYYAAADVLIAPSRQDSFNLPVLEAMACGLPVVVSARAGVSELVEDGRDALVVDDPEDVAGLAAAIERALNEPVASRLAANGRALAERTTWDDNAQRTADLVMREITTPRFLILSSDAFGTGGIERATRTLIRTLGERSGADRVGVISVWGGHTDLPARILRRGRRSGGGRPVPMAERAAYAASTIRQAWRWRRRLVVLACHPHLAPLAVAAGRVAGARVAVWCHGDEVWGPLRPSVRSALRRADLVFAPSRFTAEQAMRWAGLDREPTIVPHAVPPGVQPRRAAPVAGRVLAVARLEPHDRYKGIDTLIEAWPKVLVSHPDAELVIAGDGADRGRLERLAVDRSRDGRIRFTGRVGDEALQELYRTAELFALPTSASVGPNAAGEGFGLVFLEAAAAGLPVVAGRSGAVPEVVEDGLTGLLVDSADPDAVANAIATLLGDRELRTRMGRAARSRARERFSYDAFGDRIETLLGDLASVFRPSA